MTILLGLLSPLIMINELVESSWRSPSTVSMLVQSMTEAGYAQVVMVFGTLIVRLVGIYCSALCL